MKSAQITIKAALLLLFLAFTASCSSMGSYSGVYTPTIPPAAAASAPGHPPQILDSFAVSSLWQGQMWRIFVQGEDPDGDMDHLWVFVTQVGQKTANDIIVLKGNDRRAFAGYLALNTPRRIGLWETVRVEIKIKDRAGNYSPVRIHEALIGSPTTEAIPSKWAQFDDRRLGNIFFDFEHGNEREGLGIDKL